MKRTITMMFVAFLVVLNLNAQSKRPDHKSKSDLILGKKRSFTNLPSDDKSIKRQKVVQSIYKQKRTDGETIKLDSIAWYYDGIIYEISILEHYLENGNYVIKDEWYEYDEDNDSYYGINIIYTTFDSDGNIIKEETHAFEYEEDLITNLDVLLSILPEYKYEYEYDNNGNNIKIYYYEIDENDEEWELIEETVIEYNTDDYPIKETTVEYDEDEDDWIVTEEFMYIYTFNENGLLANITIDEIVSNDHYIYGLYSSIEYTYDENNFLIKEELFFVSQNPSFEPQKLSYEYEYDSDGNAVIEIYKFYKYSTVENEFVLESGSETQYEFDTNYLISDLMLSGDMYELTLADYNKHIVTKGVDVSYYIKSLGSWVDGGDDEIVFYYSESNIVSTQNTNTTSSKFNVFPNPTSDKITFSGLASGSIVNIYDMTGVLVLSKTVAQNEAVLVSNLSKGIYIATSISGNKQETTRFVVE